MKKLILPTLLLLAVLIVFSNFGYGQEKSEKRKLYFSVEGGHKYFREFEVGDASFSSYSELVSHTPMEFAMYLSHDLNTKNTVSLGISIYDGFFQGGKVAPLMADYKHYFKENRNSWFVNGGLGYSLLTPSDLKTFVVKGGGGYRFSVGRKINMYISAYYDLNRLMEIPIFSQGSSTTTDYGDVNIYSFNVRIGVSF